MVAGERLCFATRPRSYRQPERGSNNADRGLRCGSARDHVRGFGGGLVGGRDSVVAGKVGRSSGGLLWLLVMRCSSGTPRLA
jgi:hypothetical protein